MQVSLTRATKVHAVPKLLDKLNAALGAPTVAPLHGEGSSFLSLPTKRNPQPLDRGNVSNINNNKNNNIGNGDLVKSMAATPIGGMASSAGTVAVPATIDFERVLGPMVHTILKEGGSRPCSSSMIAMDVDASAMIASGGCWYELNQLRVHAGAPERSEQGVQRLMQYYAQLCWLEDVFPFATGEVSTAND